MKNKFIRKILTLTIAVTITASSTIYAYSSSLIERVAEEAIARASQFATIDSPKQQEKEQAVGAEKTTMDTGSAATYTSFAMTISDENGNRVIWNPNTNANKWDGPKSVLQGESKNVSDCINQNFPTEKVKEFFESVYGAGNCDFSKLHISMIVEVRHKGESYTYDGTLADEFCTPDEYWNLVQCKEGRLFDTSDPAQLEALKKWASWACPADFDKRNDIILYLVKQGVDPEVAKEVAKEAIASTSNCTFSEVYSYSDSGPSIRDVSSRIATCMPKFYTYNWSDKYNIGPASANLRYGDKTTSSTGIPSGEDVTNGFGADDWIAGFNVQYFEDTRNISAYVQVRYYQWETVVTEWVSDAGSPDGLLYVDGRTVPGKTERVQVWYSIGEHFNDMTRKAGFYFVTDPQCYEFSNANIHNGVYPGGTVTYSKIYKNI